MMNAKKIFEEFCNYTNNYIKTGTVSNILESIHLSENDHSGVLAQILRYKINGEYLFCRSFLDMLKVPYEDKDVESFKVHTQYKAIGQKGDKYGYIDLMIQIQNKAAIAIENKACGALDAQFQLQRYYCSLIKDPDMAEAFAKRDKDFWGSKDKKGEKPFSEVHLVYLTSDGTKTPSTDSETAKDYSISQSLKDELKNKYHEVDYLNDILPWIQEKVLPKLEKDANMMHSIKLYIDYLEKILCINDKTVNDYLEDDDLLSLFGLKSKTLDASMFGEFDTLYKDLLSMKKGKAEDQKGTSEADIEKIEMLDELIKRVLCYRNTIFSSMAPKKWVLYATSGYIKIFKPEWKEKFGGQKFSTVSFTIFKWNRDDRSYCVSIENKSYCEQKALQEFLVSQYGEARHTSNNYFTLPLKDLGLEFKSDSTFFADFVENKVIKKITDEIDATSGNK